MKDRLECVPQEQHETDDWEREMLDEIERSFSVADYDVEEITLYKPAARCAREA